MTQIILPIIISFTVAIILGPLLIPMLKRLKFGQTVRNDGPQNHLSKSGTPTMGGLIIILAAVVSILLFAENIDTNIIIIFIAFIGFGIIGFIDDAIIAKLKRPTGLRAWQKILLQIVLSVVAAILINNTTGSELYIPFIDSTVDLGWMMIPFAAFVLIALTNSVNLTDGQDGLVSSITLIIFITYVIIFTQFELNLNSNLVLVSTAMIGACIGFLFYNSYPARIFMGDTGSLAIGGVIGTVALLSKTALWIPIMGIMFIASAVSVIIQVTSYKLTKKRVFKMAPLHHHFEQKGYHEVKITSVYIIITIILCLIGVLAVK